MRVGRKCEVSLLFEQDALLIKPQGVDNIILRHLNGIFPLAFHFPEVLDLEQEIFGEIFPDVFRNRVWNLPVLYAAVHKAKMLDKVATANDFSQASVYWEVRSSWKAQPGRSVWPS